MQQLTRHMPIGVFDSGMGGISVLKRLVKLMPNEDFIFIGDSKNAPYGTRPTEEVVQLSEQMLTYLKAKPVKAVVIACNTATSAAADLLRANNALPIIGIEPALKPAVEAFPGRKIVVLATELTLREHKFRQQQEHFDSQATIVPLAAPKLVEFVEAGKLDTPEVVAYLSALLKAHHDAAAIVLGCTHFPFVKAALQKVVAPNTAIIDGGLGVAKQTKRLLTQQGLANDATNKGKVIFENTNKDVAEITLSKRLFETNID